MERDKWGEYPFGSCGVGKKWGIRKVIRHCGGRAGLESQRGDREGLQGGGGGEKGGGRGVDLRPPCWG